MAPFRSFTLYLDETGDHSLTKINSQFPVFGLGGVIIQDELLSQIAEQLNRVKLEVFGSSDIVLHSVDLRKRRKEFAVLNDPNKMSLFYEIFNSFLIGAEISFVSIFINKPMHLKRYKDPYDPYIWAMDLLLERFMYFLKSQNATGKIITESRGKREDKEINDAFLRSMLLGTRYADHASLVKHIDNELIFQPKKDNGTGLQLADMMLYPVARALLNDDPRNPAFHIVASKMHVKYGCNVLPADSHPRWLTKAYTNNRLFSLEYPSVLLPQKT